MRLYGKTYIITSLQVYLRPRECVGRACKDAGVPAMSACMATISVLRFVHARHSVVCYGTEQPAQPPAQRAHSHLAGSLRALNSRHWRSPRFAPRQSSSNPARTVTCRAPRQSSSNPEHIVTCRAPRQSSSNPEHIVTCRAPRRSSSNPERIVTCRECGLCVTMLC